jgi:hypothetical protein
MPAFSIPASNPLDLPRFSKLPRTGRLAGNVTGQNCAYPKSIYVRWLICVRVGNRAGAFMSG